NLETPHHIIERLRFDDPRLEELQSSYQHIQQEEEVTSLTPHRTHEIKARPEAVVKGITPAQPAPGANGTATTAQDGLWQRIISRFKGPEATDSTQKIHTPEETISQQKPAQDSNQADSQDESRARKPAKKPRRSTARRAANKG